MKRSMQLQRVSMLIIMIMLIIVQSAISALDNGKKDLTALHLALKDEFEEEESIQHLIEQNKDLETPDFDGYTPLHMVALRGFVKCAKLLIEKGVDKYAREKDGYTPFHTFIMDRAERETSLYHEERNIFDDEMVETIDIVKLFLDKGVSIDVQTQGGETALFFTIDKNALNIAELLLRKGANKNARNQEGLTPYLIACLNGNKAMIELFIKYKVDQNVRSLKELFIKHKVNQNIKNLKKGQGPLHLAIMGAKEGEDDQIADLVQLLIEKGAEKDAQDIEGNTPLHHATHLGLPRVIERLLKHKANVEIRANHGITPLSLALAYHEYFNRSQKKNGECEHREEIIRLLVLMGKASLDRLSENACNYLARLGITKKILERTRYFEEKRHKHLIAFLSTIPNGIINIIIEYDDSFDTKVFLFTNAQKKASSPTKEHGSKKRKHSSITHSTY